MTTKTDEKLQKSELLNIFKPPKPIQIGFTDFIKELAIMTVVLIVFFWCGASFHTLMHGYKQYKMSDFQGWDVNKVPYTCDVPPKDGDSMFSLKTSSSAYCPNGLETIWGIFPEIIDWYQNTSKDIFSSSRKILMRLIMQVRGNYVKSTPPEDTSGFFGLMASSIIGGTAVFASPALAACLILFYGFTNIKHFFFVMNETIVLKNKDGTNDIGGAEGSWWIANGNDSYVSPAFWIKIAKWCGFNFVFFLIGLCLMFASVPLYMLSSMSYWVTMFAAKGDKSFNKEGKFNDIWNILKNHGTGIASFWILLGGLIAWKNLGFGATIAAIVVLILHMGMNFYGYMKGDSINI
jgi:hypothetical protein